MPFGYLLRFIAPGAVDAAAALHRFAFGDVFGPAQYVGVFVYGQEFGGRVDVVAHQLAIPGPDGNIGDGVGVTGQVAVVGEALVEDVQLAFVFHGEAVDGVLEFFRGIDVEVAEASTQVRRRAHLPEQPIEGFGAACRILG